MEEFLGQSQDDSVMVEPSSGSALSVMGKQIAFNNAIQYVGAKIPPKDIGLILKSMPLLNKEMAFKGLTQDHDIADNMILALNRGQPVQVNPAR